MRALLLLLGIGLAAVAADQPDTSVEHQVDNIDAYDAGLEIFRLSEASKSGCRACSSEDMDYCISSHLLRDHCCCDHNQPEKYPFIIHKCHKRDLPLCEPVAGDCHEYLRLDTCCCQPYLRNQWQYYWWHAPRNAGGAVMALTVLSITIVLTIHYAIR